MKKSYTRKFLTEVSHTRKSYTRILYSVLTLVILTMSLVGLKTSIISAEPPVDTVDTDNKLDPYRHMVLYNPRSSLRKFNPEPRGYRRVPTKEVSGFGIWLRNFPMTSKNEPLTTYSGTFLATREMIGGALDLSTPAPAQHARGTIYRLMIEYSRHTETELEINFRGIKDDTLSMYKYMTGTYRTNHDRTELRWHEGEMKEFNEDEFIRFMHKALSVTSYRSLARDCQEILEEEALPGDLFIQIDEDTLRNSHLVILMDVAEKDTSVKTIIVDSLKAPVNRLYLFAQSLTPATNFHVVKPILPKKQNWFNPGELQRKMSSIGPGKFYRLPYKFLQ